MNKASLVNAVAGRIGSRKVATAAVEAVFDVIVRAVAEGQPVSVTGFGTFAPKARAARAARNPQTGERIALPGSTVPVFRAGQGFRDLLTGVRPMPSEGISAIRKSEPTFDV
jgi:DNA-binding protein HU-beta